MPASSRSLSLRPLARPPGTPSLEPSLWSHPAPAPPPPARPATDPSPAQLPVQFPTVVPRRTTRPMAASFVSHLSSRSHVEKAKGTIPQRNRPFSTPKFARPRNRSAMIRAIPCHLPTHCARVVLSLTNHALILCNPNHTPLTIHFQQLIPSLCFKHVDNQRTTSIAQSKPMTTPN